MIPKIKSFLRESYAEMKKITWPTKESLWGGTLGVFLISFLLVIYMWILDMIFSKILSYILG